VFETDGDCNPGQQPIASKRLQVVQVKYHKDRVLVLQKILKILITGGVPSEKVVTERMISWTSGSKLTISILHWFLYLCRLFVSCKISECKNFSDCSDNGKAGNFKLV
jgi:hypothetical protein